MRSKYSYVVLRYVHDILSGEQLNVGVVVLSAEARYLGALCRPTYARLARTFPGFRGDAFRKTMRYIQAEIERLAERVADSAPFESLPRSVLELVTQVLPRDDSSFKWSEAGVGVTDDLPKALEDLYERLVTRCDDKEQSERRTDEDVWKGYRKELESRHLLQYLQPKTIATTDDEIEFRHAWKNGSWHCLEPVSFDLMRSDSIREKAHKVLGELTSLRDAKEQFRVYLLVGGPQSEGMCEEYEKALSIIDKAPTPKEVITEQNAKQFLDKFEKMIEASGHG